MLTFSKDPTCYLVTEKDLAVGNPLPLPQEDITALRQITSWAREYLCKPNPSLGRDGPVCPFVERALDLNLFFLTALRRQAITQGEVFGIVQKYREWYNEIDPREGWRTQYKTILILLPGISSEEATLLIDGTQRMLKPEFVEHGLMIGQFHAGPPQEPGLWNPDFRPFNSPIPMLVIRQMVPTDLPFLNKEEHFVVSYLKRFGDHLPETLKCMANEAIKTCRHKKTE